MPKARKHQISLDITPYYHCVSRCVRRAFLCGRDKYSDRSYEHRRAWIEERILQLAQIFAIDICAYAVMTNHYHLVLHVNSAKALQWSDREVCVRWHQLYKGTPLTQKYLRHSTLTAAEADIVKSLIARWRMQLVDISWFMRNINEPIARQANMEDDCTGRFWEGRFKSQALLDEKALIACMTYVDLNPVRAGVAKTPETSDYTSIRQRLRTIRNSNAHETIPAASLYPFTEVCEQEFRDGIPFGLRDYLDLVDWTGRIIRNDKCGSIPDYLPPILQRIAIQRDQWIYLATRFESRFKTFVGCVYKIRQAARQLGYQRAPGLSENQTAFG